MQHARGFIVGCANRVTLISWEAEPTEQQIGRAFMGKKPHYQHITYGLQSDWLHVCKAILLVQTSGYNIYKAILLVQLRGLLFKLKAILLVQTARAFVQT